MKWVRSSYDFGSPCVILTVDVRSCHGHAIRDALTRFEGDPAAVEGAVLKVIEECRPELNPGLGSEMEMDLFPQAREPTDSPHVREGEGVGLLGCPPAEPPGFSQLPFSSQRNW